jgi:PAS domain S-box-containing protein
MANTAAQIGTFDLDLATYSIVWSDNLHEMVGLPKSQPLTFDLFLGLTHPDDRQRVREAVRNALELGEEYNLEFRMVRPDHTVRWCAARGQVLRDSSGKPYRFIGVDVDITKLKEAEETLRNSNQRMTEVADAMPTIVYECGADGFCTYVNRRWFEYTGTSVQSGLSDSWRDNLHPDDRERVWHRWMESVQSGNNFELEYRVRVQEGEYHWNLARAVPIRDANGTILRWIGTCTDIHEFKLAEESRHTVEENYRFIFNAVPQIIWTTDATGMADSFNRAWVEHTGITLEKSTGLQWSSVIHPADLPELERAWRESLHTGNPYEHEARYRGKDGSYRRFLIRAQALKDESGKVIRWFGTSTDVESQRRQEELLLQSERLSTAIKLASTIAHEVNNPLAAVVNALFLISEDKTLDETTRRYVDIASEELNRVSHIVRQNLAFYRERQDLLTVSLSSIIQDVLGFLKSQMKSRRVQAQQRFETPGDVRGVETELRQLILNLLLNALEACPDNSTLRIRIRPASALIGRGKVQLTVANRGTVSDSVLNRLFQPFVTSRPEKGKGLGLWVARGIVNKHHGDIFVRTSLRFGWTVVTVTLPQVERAAEIPEPRKITTQ